MCAAPQAFRPAERISRPSEFRQVYQQGRRSSGRFMTIFVLRTDRPISRLGVAATRKVGGAVDRNRAKRLARELFRRNKPAAGFDVVVVARREMLDVPFSKLETEYRETLRRPLRSL